ncbi:unnamed protein product [Calypogeia fissa]
MQATGAPTKDCTNEPHFRRDSQSRPNLQQAGTDSEEAPTVLLHPVVPPVGSLHQPQDHLASPCVADPLVRSPAAVTGDTDCPPPAGNTVPISNLHAVSPLIPPNLTPSDSITMEVERLDDDPGHALVSVTSPSLPDHLRIRTTPWPTNSLPAPNLVANSLDKEVRISPPLTSLSTVPTPLIDPLIHSPGNSPTNHGNSSGSKRWADYSSDSENEIETLSHTPGGSRLVISPHQLTAETRHRERSLSPYKRDSHRINLKSAARQARRTGNAGT